jgi:PTS system nitrogen regulatory IIA component
MPHTIFNIEQVAEYLNLPVRLVQRLVRNQQIPFEQTGSRVVFRRSEIDAWASQRILSLRTDDLRAFHATTARGADDASGRITLITDYIRPDTIEPDVAAKTKAALLRAMVKVADRTELVYDPGDLLRSLEEREQLCSTALPGGFAVLHPRHHEPYMFADAFLTLGRVSRPIPFGSPDGTLTDLFFLLCCPNDRIHLHLLSRVCLACNHSDLLQGLRDAETADEMYDRIAAAEKDVLPKRPGAAP